MSRGFVKEEDQEEVPLIAPRPPIPSGLPNYVTPYGHKALIEEKEALSAEMNNLSGSEADRRIALTTLQCRLSALQERIQSARIISEPPTNPSQIAFGACVGIRMDNDAKIRYVTICGADEANATEGKIAFFSPLARTLTGHCAGERLVMRLNNASHRIIIVNVNYSVQTTLNPMLPQR